MPSSGRLYQSRGSGPFIASSISALSSTVLEIGPACDTSPKADAGWTATLPKVGLCPNTPEKAAGMRIEPPASVPTASGQIPAARATALPPLLPPGVRSRFHGLRVTPESGESVVGFQPNSGVVVLPKKIAPAARRRATAGESSLQFWLGSIVREPTRRGQPRVNRVSLTATGTPSSRPFGSPFCHRASDARASAVSLSGSYRTKALTPAS